MLVGDRQLERLRKLITRLKAGGTVTKRDMRAVLTVEELAAHDADWQSVKAFGDDIRKTPDDLKSYLLLLRKADAIAQRAEEQAEAAYERALENLAEALGVDAGLSAWLERLSSCRAATPRPCSGIWMKSHPR